MWPVKIATFVATIYLKEFIIHTNNLINPSVSQIKLVILDQALHEENSNIVALQKQMFYQTICNIDESAPYVYPLQNDFVIENMADISTVNGKKVAGKK